MCVALIFVVWRMGKGVVLIFLETNPKGFGRVNIETCSSMFSVVKDVILRSCVPLSPGENRH